MPTLYAILYVLLSFPPHVSDTETPPERFARMATTAVAIDSAVRRATCFEAVPPCKRVWRGSPFELVADTITKGKYESDFARAVHTGERTGDHGRSLSFWQLQPNDRLKPSEWERISGTSEEATTLAAWHAVLALSSATMLCNSRGERERHARFALYGTGRVCSTSWSQRRAETAERVQRDLVRMTGGKR